MINLLFILILLSYKYRFLPNVIFSIHNIIINIVMASENNRLEINNNYFLSDIAYPSSSARHWRFTSVRFFVLYSISLWPRCVCGKYRFTINNYDIWHSKVFLSTHIRIMPLNHTSWNSTLWPTEKCTKQWVFHIRTTIELKGRIIIRAICCMRKTIRSTRIQMVMCCGCGSGAICPRIVLAIELNADAGRVCVVFVSVMTAIEIDDVIRRVRWMRRSYSG